MVTIDPVWLVVIIYMTAMGFIGTSYESFARSYGWTVGELFTAGRLASVSIIVVPFALGFVWYEYGLIIAIIVLVVGFMLAFLLTIVLRDRVQLLWGFSFLAAVAYIGYRLLMKYVF